ncbi:ABC transporter substrate-binding protein [Nonomuraea sp. MCN248]|uniref:ABC transporter substrate-binding protein n=1 Tax=Nonomuraea corallina TaxID=2989783 RepID=A0ABT4SFF4_9ACTN|nr:ABC transporter substrate-binding protein [Nonomuraea corallina]MDA0635875.1 ABC transporter substrate-binding protein [Nonomuraea corallina]
MTWLGEQLGRIADDMPERDLAARAIAAHQRRRRNVMALAAAAVAVVTMIAVTVAVRALPGEPRAAARPSAPPELPVIKVGTLPTAESAPVYVAQSQGYFEEEGLTVEPVLVTGAGAATPPVEAGRLDLAYTDYVTLFRANERGKDFTIVAGLYRSAPGDLAIVVNARSKIRTVRDLKRKKIAIPNLGGLGQLTVTAALKRAGLKPRDVMMAEKPYPEMLHALSAGQFDAALLVEPFVTVGRERSRIVADAIPPEFASLPTAGLAATAEWVREHPRTLAAFQRALAKAQRLIANDPRQVREVLPTYSKTSPKEAAAMTLGSYPAELDLTELKRVADLTHAHGLVERPVDLRGAVGG